MEPCNKNREIDNIHADLKEVRTDVKILLKKVEQLRVKASIWGILGGAIPALITIAIAVAIHSTK